jgi:hypothetical protein
MARPARIFLAAELLLGIAYFLLPDSLLRAVVYCTLGLGMMVAVVVGTRLHRPAQPLAWYLLAGGQLSFTVGDAINYTYQWVLEVEPPYPSVADGFYLACYALLAGGLLLLVRERAPGRDLASLIDATIITVGVGLLSWVFLIGPNVRAPTCSCPSGWSRSPTRCATCCWWRWRCGCGGPVGTPPPRPACSPWGWWPSWPRTRCTACRCSAGAGTPAARWTPPGSSSTSGSAWPPCTRRWSRSASPPRPAPG